MHGLVATCHAISPCVRPVPVPWLLTFVQVRPPFFASSMVEEFTLFSFHISLSVQEQHLYNLTLADRNWLKNMPWQVFSAYKKFGGNQCRDGQFSPF